MCNTEEFCQKLREYQNITKDQFLYFRNQIMDEPNDIIRAVYYFIINRCSFSGATLSGGFSQESSNKRFTESSIDRVSNLKLTKFDIMNSDFVDFINGYYDSAESFMFLDPPYMIKSNLYGKNGDMHENFNHQLLRDTLNGKSNWIMTYNDCETIRELYKDHVILNAAWNYGMNSTKKSSEIIILSILKSEVI